MVELVMLHWQIQLQEKLGVTVMLVKKIFNLLHVLSRVTYVRQNQSLAGLESIVPKIIPQSPLKKLIEIINVAT
jgi:hypothetical protein